jgi:hypothetical protein
LLLRIEFARRNAKALLAGLRSFGVFGGRPPLSQSGAGRNVLPADAKPADHGLDKPDLITVQDFNRSTYTLKIGRSTTEAYPVQVSVAADPVKERTPKSDEKAEEKAKLDQEFKDHLNQLEEKAATEKQYEKRPYLVPKSTLDPFFKDRAELLAKKPSPSPTPASGKKR